MNKKAACKINNIEYPSADKITSRISTLRRSMACTLLNRDACTPEQEREWLKFFPDNTCAYCGQEATHLDHLNPMIRDNEPTGYGTDPGDSIYFQYVMPVFVLRASKRNSVAREYFSRMLGTAHRSAVEMSTKIQEIVQGDVKIR